MEGASQVDVLMQQKSSSSHFLGGGGGGFADGLGFGVANTIAASATGTKTLSNFIVGG